VVHTEMLPIPKLGKKDILVRVSTAGVGYGGIHRSSMARSKTVEDEGFRAWSAPTAQAQSVAIGDSVQRFASADAVYGWGFGESQGWLSSPSTPPSPSAILAIRWPDSGLVRGCLARWVRLRVDHGTAGASSTSTSTKGDSIANLRLRAAVSVTSRCSSRSNARCACSQSHRNPTASRLVGNGLVPTASPKDAASHSSASSRDFAPAGLAGALVFTGVKGWKKRSSRS